ncbi:surface antigen [Plasmodium falciparum UGT5.1]|uniref:Surface antigen n=1 Tax=Plasmodium falciparum UGT5.1 TaxID=1237627 RepID=W7JJE5_PLAFA|nr:surface antigen [Plasmodium falciparum UGT5.1]
MKLHCSKILLFALPLNILITSSNVNTHKKPYITPHTSTTTSRVLSECDLYIRKYDNDADMKSVRENFDRQTSQRFEEYEERIKDKRQKRKEQRDKNIQKIIEKDRMDKSLAEKVEKCCLICGCGLGGVAASVGLFGGLGIYGWKTAALATAKEAAKDAAMAAGEVARLKAGKDAVIAGIIKEFRVSTVGVPRLESLFTENTYNIVIKIAEAINDEYNASSCLLHRPVADNSICPWVLEKSLAAQEIPGNAFSTYNSIEVAVGTIVTDAETVAERAVETATDEAIQRSIGVVDAKYAICQTAIIASVVAILTNTQNY